MSTKQKVIFSFLFLFLGIFSFGTGVWLGGALGGGLSESIMFLSNGEYHDEVFECGLTGDVECFKEEYGNLIHHNTIYANMLIDQDMIGFSTAELQDRISVYNQQKDQLR